MKTISTRIPDEMGKVLEEIEEEEKADRATVVRKLLAKGIEDWRRERALQLYREGKITLWLAARRAGISLREMMGLAAERGIEFRYTEKDLAEDIAVAIKGK